MLLLSRKIKLLFLAFSGLMALVFVIANQSAALSQSLESVQNIISEQSSRFTDSKDKDKDAEADSELPSEDVVPPKADLVIDKPDNNENKDGEDGKYYQIDGKPPKADNTEDSKNSAPKIASGHHNDQAEDSSDEKAKENKESKEEEEDSKAEEEPKKSDPESLEDSSYAKSEFENELVDEEKVKEIIEEYAEEEAENKSPAENVLNKDWSIKIDDKLSKVTSKEFLKGSKITKSFFTQLLQLIYGNRLSFPLEQRMHMENGKTIIDNIIFYAESSDTLSEVECGTFMDFPDNFIEDLTTKHKIVVDNIPDIEPNFYSGSGYVIVGGGKYSWFSFLVIKTLRKLGSFLPVEIIIPSHEDYEETFCEKILPKYDARCVKIHDVFDSQILEDIKVTGYQYKSLALLASSFENAFLLDSDNYPVVNPDPLFSSELYYEHTLITWPDYWRRTTSPKFYQVRGTKLGKRVRHLNDFKTDPKYFKVENEDDDEEILKSKVPMHDREGSIPDWTTESGEMLINKKIHFKALLLALYYNLDGQFGYYPLLSQGGAGEGDKETFVAASNFYNLNYYQVNKMPDRAYGFFKYGNFYDTSIIQYNPLKDYENLQKVYKEIDEKIEKEGDEFSYDYTSLFTDHFRIDNSQPMFYHVHETKMDPFALYENKGTVDLDGKKMRNLGGDFPRVDFDLERYLWQLIEKYVCVDSLDFAYFAGKDKEAVCGDFLKEQLKFLDETGYELLKRYVASEPYDNLRRTN